MMAKKTRRGNVWLFYAEKFGHQKMIMIIRDRGKEVIIINH
jgi:hypothetical protein